MKNPFYPVAEFPDFPAMTPAAAEEALPLLLADASASVDALEEHAVPTWNGFIIALDDATRPLWTAWGIIGHLLSVSNTEEWRRVQEKFQPELVAFSLRVGQSRRFYELAKTVPAETPVRRRILDKMIQSAELAGVALPPEKRDRFNALQAELARLSTTFRDHVMDATKAFSLTLTKPEEVDGLPAQIREMIARDGGWRATVEDAVYVPFMKHARNRAVREALCRARATRASTGDSDNTNLIGRLLACRAEMASLLGFASYADLSLAAKAAPSVAAVIAMVDELDAVAAPVAVQENADLVAFRQKASPKEADAALAPWDISFWAERQRETRYAYSEEELSHYLNFPDVLNGLFALAGNLFGIAIEELTGTVPVWHKDVRFFRVYDEFHTPVASFYLDPYSRPETKSGGAWMNEFRTRELRADGTLMKPLAVICCNQVLPDAKGRALMRFSEVETLFHEFGHALQQMLTKVDDADASGLNLIEWDAVEVASQFMENWCFDAATVRKFARHVETGAPIPEDLLTKIRAAKNERAANANQRQLSFAVLDLVLHANADMPLPAALRPFTQKINKARAAGTFDAVKKCVFDVFTPGMTVPEDRFLNAFTHIFAGGYAAGYYGYKWSEVMSADVFGAFEEAGLDDNAAVRRVGRRYRDTFLALGGSLAPMDVFKLFRGRAPSAAALLRQSGLRA